MQIYILLALLGLIGIYALLVYNRLIKLENLSVEAWSGIDVQLKKRHDLIPRLVEIVKGYATHEKTLLESIAMLRTKAMGTSDIKEQEQTQIEISKSLGNLIVVVENYPELKANQNFLELQKEISVVEHDLQRARRYYNGTVRNMNILVQQFPSSLVASIFGKTRKQFFDIKNETERAVPVVGL
jgi:LemA protein